MWVTDEGTRQCRPTDSAQSQVSGYEVRGGLGMAGQEGVRMAKKWVQRRGQIPAHKELRRTRSPNMEAGEEAEAPSRRGFSSSSSPRSISEVSFAEKIPIVLELPNNDLTGEAMHP